MRPTTSRLNGDHAMSALRKPNFETQYNSPKPHSKTIKKSDRSSSLSSQKQTRKIVSNRTFPQQNRLPQNLKLLSWLQRVSFYLALCSMATSVGVYAATVKIPQLWSQEYRNLENLQRQERELIAINEKIKYQIAREASKDNRLSISKPESAVFIAPAKVNSKSELQLTKEESSLAKIKYNNLGY